MATGITRAQLDTVRAMVTVTNSDVAGAWKLLASYGDTYAAQAYTVIAEPTVQVP